MCKKLVDQYLACSSSGHFSGIALNCFLPVYFVDIFPEEQNFLGCSNRPKSNFLLSFESYHGTAIHSANLYLCSPYVHVHRN